MSSGTARISCALRPSSPSCRTPAKPRVVGASGGRLEEEPDALRRAAVGRLRLDGEEERRLAFHHLLHQLGVVLEPVREFRKFARELKQQLQPFGFGQGLEVVDNFRQRGGEG